MATATRPAGSSGGQKKSFLAQVQRSGQKLPSRVVLQGVPGIGKTSFAAHAPGVIFGMPEDETGLITLLDSGLLKNIPYLPLWESWSEVLDSIDELITADHEYKTLVVDGLGGVERLCHEYVCKRDYQGRFNREGFLSYMQGYETALGDWRQFLAKLDQLRLTKRMSIMLLAHTKIGPYRNPNGEDYDRYLVDIHYKTWAVTNRWADVVMFANHSVETVKSGARHKGRGGQQRVIYTTYDAGWDAKNRHNLPELIEMGGSAEEAWSNFKAAMKNGAKP